MTRTPNRDKSGEGQILVPWFKMLSASLFGQSIMAVVAMTGAWPLFLGGQMNTEGTSVTYSLSMPQ